MWPMHRRSIEHRLTMCNKYSRRLTRLILLQLFHVTKKGSRESRNAVENVGATFTSIGESVKEATKLGAISFGLLDFLWILKIAEVLLPKARFFTSVLDRVGEMQVF